ncbi:MAG TPA: class I SAM-dependent methyltransferase [Solirubrobacteraceae bacterium]|nr:class I SAM-dependent methyltransferase [Solirubrobacteraceae bacterium]
MSKRAIAHFDRVAADYEATRRRVVPSYDAFYGSAIAALGLARREIRRVLDLGAGTGLLSTHVASAYPDAELTLLDGAEGMLGRARETLGERASYVLADLTDSPPGDEPWDAIVSALAIHHLDDAAKRELFARVHSALWPGGVFVNAEQVAGPTGLFDDAYDRWHEREAKALGTTDTEWQEAIESMRHDRTASVEHQLAWLREAGFADADCLWKDHRLAVLVARRAG